MNYLAEIPFEINDEPVTIAVTHFYKQEPDYTNDSSDMDYYGYSEAEWDILDIEGNKLTDTDDVYLWDEIEQAILDHFAAQEHEYDL